MLVISFVILAHGSGEQCKNIINASFEKQILNTNALKQQQVIYTLKSVGRLISPSCNDPPTKKKKQSQGN